MFTNNETLATHQHTPLANSEILKSYFTKVVNLHNSGEKFPVSLEDVWLLAFPRKDHAVRELTKSEFFFEGIDYTCFLKNGESSGHGGDRKTMTYKLSVSAMEWLIAKKARPVFEVYRKMFHITINKVGRRLGNFNEGERQLLTNVQRYYVKGDSIKIAKMIDCRPKSVIDVKNGVYRNHVIMAALAKVCGSNKKEGRTAANQYTLTQLSLMFND